MSKAQKKVTQCWTWCLLGMRCLVRVRPVYHVTTLSKHMSTKCFPPRLPTVLRFSASVNHQGIEFTLNCKQLKAFQLNRYSVQSNSNNQLK